MENSAKKMGGGTNLSRNSNLELFRIITMFFIVAHHYVVNSGLMAADGPVYANPLSWRSLFLIVFGGWGKTGINCFVLITGYFMCKSKITARKFCKLLFEIEFYKILIWCIFLITGYESFSWGGLVNALLPIRNISNGFISCYLIFFLFIPFLNMLIQNLTERQHIKLLALCVFTYVIIGTIPKFGITMNYVSWFIVLYFIGAYFRIYDKKIFQSAKIWGWITLFVLVVSVASIVFMTWLNVKTGKGGLGLGYYFLADSNKVLAVVLSISAFLFFKNIKMKNNRFINRVAASAFGVLLIHANSDAMRQWLWQDVLNNVGMYGSQWLIFHAIGSVLAVYIICTIIDYLRIRLIEAPLFRLWDKYWDRIRNKYIAIEDKFFGKITRESDIKNSTQMNAENKNKDEEKKTEENV